MNSVHKIESLCSTSDSNPNIIDDLSLNPVVDINNNDNNGIDNMITIQFITFGVETGTRPKLETLNHPIFRCDWITNPSSSSRKNSTGQSKKLRNEVLSQPGVMDFVEKCAEEIMDVVNNEQYDDDNSNHTSSVKYDEDNLNHNCNKNSYSENRDFKFAFSCAHGKHRSVSVAMEVGNVLAKSQGNGVVIQFQHLALLEGKDAKKGRKKSRRKKSYNSTYHDIS